MSSGEFEVKITKVGTDKLVKYAAIPSEFTMESILEAERIDGGFGGITLKEKEVDSNIRDLSQYEDPLEWKDMADKKTWVFFMAFHDEKAVGAAAAACKTETINLIDGREDLAVLWDIRVHPDYKNMGIGKALFKNIEEWAKSNRCRHIKVETQNTNVPACKFLSKVGCELMEISQLAYYGDGDTDIMLCWYLEL